MKTIRQAISMAEYQQVVFGGDELLRLEFHELLRKLPTADTIFIELTDHGATDDKS